MVPSITHIFVKLHVNVSENFVRNARTDIYNIMCSIDAHAKIIHHEIMMETVVVVIHYYKI